MSEKTDFEEASKRRKSLDRHSSNALTPADDDLSLEVPQEPTTTSGKGSSRPFGGFMSSLFKGSSDGKSPSTAANSFSWLSLRSDKVNMASLTFDNLNKITAPNEAVAALKYSLELKSDEYFHAALDLITHLCEQDPSKQVAIELGNQGACGYIDQILGLKSTSSHSSECCLRAMCSLVTPPADRGESSPRMCGGGGGGQRDSGVNSEALAAIQAGISSNRKKLSSSGAIYRIIKACYTHLSDVIVLEWGLRVVSCLALEDGMVPKLMACGGCDLMIQSLNNHKTQNDIVLWVCRNIYNFITCDVEGGNAQEKFSDSGVCECLVSVILTGQSDKMSELAAVWILRAIGALARYNETNKRRLGSVGIAPLINKLYQRFGLGSRQFSESICWAIGNLSFPDENNQDALGSEAACEIVSKSLKTHVNAVLVVQESLRAIRNLCHGHTGNQDQLYALGIVQIVMTVLRQYRELQSDVMQWIWYVIATLAEHEKCLLDLGNDGITSAVVGSLNRFSESEDLVQWAALAVNKIAGHEELSLQLGTSQCCPAISQALAHHLNNADVVEEVLNAIGTLSNQAANRAAFAKLNVCDTVVKALIKHEKVETVVESGLFAAMSLIQSSAAVSAVEGTTDGSDAGTSTSSRDSDTNDKLIAAFIAASAFKVFPRVLARHAESEYVAEYGCRALCDLVNNTGELDSSSPILPSTAALSGTHRLNNAMNMDTLLKLGQGGAASSLCSVLQHHAANAYVTKFALLGLDRLAFHDKNIPLLRSAGACLLTIRAIHTHYLIAEVVQLGFSLIAHLCYEELCRDRIHAEGGLEVVLAALSQHIQNPTVAQVGCDALAGLCVSPTQDAIAFVINKENQNAVHANKEKAIASIDWINFDVANTDHLNILAANSASVSADKAAEKNNVAKDSFFHWGSVKEENTSGFDALAGAASNLISTGTSDQEAELIAAKRAALTKKSLPDRLLQCGVQGVMVQLLQTHWNNEAVLISVCNTLNSLAMYPLNRSQMSKDGVLELVAGALMRCMNFAEKAAIKSSVPFAPVPADTNALNDNGGRRILTILLNVLIGSCCLPEHANDNRPKIAKTQIQSTEKLPFINQEFLGSLSVCECLALCGEGSDSDPLMTEVTLRGLYYLLLGHDINQNKLGTTQCTQWVVRILKNHVDKPKLVYYSCLCISALAQNNRPNSLLLGEENVCEAVVRALDKYMTNEDVAEACCHAIYGLKYLNEQLGRANACEYVLQAFTQHPANATVAQWGCRAIGTLAELESNKIDLDKHNVCKIVTQALQKHVSNDSLLSAFMKDTSSSGVAQWGCTAIYYLAKGIGSDVYQQKLVAAGACEAVARALVKYSEIETVSFCCCRTLVVLLMNNEPYKAKLGNLGVCACIVESMHLYPSSVQVAKWGCRALAVLAESNEANISRIGLAGGCETIPVIIQAHQASEHVAGAGCDVISFMAEVLANGYAARLGHAGGCEAVISVLRKHYENASVASRASIALASLARDKGNSSWLGPAGACDALISALQTHQDNVAVSKFVISAIGNLCIVENNKERLGSIGACELVTSCLSTHIEDLETVKAAGLTIGKLCELILRHDANNEDTTQSPSVNTAFGVAGGTASVGASGAPSPAAPSPAAAAAGSMNLSRRRSISTLSGSLLVSDEKSVLSDSTASTVHHANRRFNRAALFEHGACEILVKALNRHLTNAAAATILCRTISIVSFGDACHKEREVLGELGACKAVTNAIQFHEGVEEVARSGCLAVKALAYYNDTNKALLLECGVSPILIVILRGYRYANSGPTTIEAAAWAISSFAMDFPRAKTALGVAGACEGLLEVCELHSRNVETTFLIVKALFHVCDGNTANRLKISFTGAADILSNVLQKYPDDDRIVEYVYSTMIGMCLDKVGQSRLGTVNMPKQVVASLYKYEKTNEYMVLLCCSLVAQLAANSKINQDKLGNAGVCKAIVLVMTKYMNSTTGSALLSDSVDSTRFNLPTTIAEEETGGGDGETSDSTEDNAGMNVGSTVEESKSALSSLIDEFSVLKEGCKAIVHLTNNNEVNRQKFLTTNVVDILTTILSSSFISSITPSFPSSKPPTSYNNAGIQVSEDTKEWAKIAMDSLIGKT